MIHTVEKNTLKCIYFLKLKKINKEFVFAEYPGIFELLNKYPTSKTEI